MQHFIFISSTSVFSQQNGHFDESQSPQPDSEIGRGLLEIEQWLANLANIDCDIIRFAGLVGADRHPVYALAGKAICHKATRRLIWCILTTVPEPFSFCWKRQAGSVYITSSLHNTRAKRNIMAKWRKNFI